MSQFNFPLRTLQINAEMRLRETPEGQLTYLADSMAQLVLDARAYEALGKSAQAYVDGRLTNAVPNSFLAEAGTGVLAPVPHVSEEQIKPGDVAYLNSGSPGLCVCAVHPGSDKTMIEVMWYDGNSTFLSATFDQRMLTTTKPGK